MQLARARVRASRAHAPERRAAGRVDRASARGEAMRTSIADAGQAGAPARDRGDVREAEAVHARSAALPAHSATWAAAALSMPSHITGATAGSAARFAGSAASEARPKWNAIRGAVASVAATVSAAPLRSGSGSRRQRPPQRPREREDADHRGEAQLPADVLPRARVQRRASRRTRAAARTSARPGGPRAPRACPAMPIAPARTIDGPAPVSGTYSAISADHRPQPRPARHAQRAEQRPREHRQQRHVLAADGQQVREPGALEVLRHALRDVLVRAQHHPARERSLRIAEARADSRFGAAPYRVDRAGEAAAPAPRERAAGRRAAPPALPRGAGTAA